MTRNTSKRVSEASVSQDSLWGGGPPAPSSLISGMLQLKHTILTIGQWVWLCLRIGTTMLQSGDHWIWKVLEAPTKFLTRT